MSCRTRAHDVCSRTALWRVSKLWHVQKPPNEEWLHLLAHWMVTANRLRLRMNPWFTCKQLAEDEGINNEQHRASFSSQVFLLSFQRTFGMVKGLATRGFLHTKQKRNIRIHETYSYQECTRYEYAFYAYAFEEFRTSPIKTAKKSYLLNGSPPLIF